MGYLMNAQLTHRCLIYGQGSPEHMMIGDGTNEVQFRSLAEFVAVEPDGLLLPDENTIQINYEALRRKMGEGKEARVVDVWMFVSRDPLTQKTRKHYLPYPDQQFEDYIDKVAQYAESQKYHQHPVIRANGVAEAKEAAKRVLNQVVDSVAGKDGFFDGYSGAEQALFAQQLDEAKRVKAGAEAKDLGLLPQLVVDDESLDDLATKIIANDQARAGVVALLKRKRVEVAAIKKLETQDAIFKRLDAVTAEFGLQDSMVFLD